MRPRWRSGTLDTGVDRPAPEAEHLGEASVILIDAGSLVALVDASDEHHRACAATLRELREPIATVWPAATKALELLQGVTEGQEAVLEMLGRGVLRLLPLGLEDVSRLQELMARYRDQPMDLAHAGLVRVAERDSVDRVFTVDRRHFGAYRIGKRKPFRIVPEAPAARRRAPRRRRIGGRRVRDWRGRGEARATR